MYKSIGNDLVPSSSITGNPWPASGCKGSLLYASDLDKGNADRTVSSLAFLFQTVHVSAFVPSSLASS